MITKISKWILFLSLLSIIGIPPAFGGVPDVKDVFVTDVTTVSFSVIWASSEPSTASLEVFMDAAGTIPVTSAVITPHPVNNGDTSIQVAAQDNGVMKVMVSGLEADTIYYFKTTTTSKSSPDITTYPEVGLLSVATEVQTVRTYESNGDILPFSNDIIIEPCYLEDGATPAEGTLLMATVAGGHYPITSFVGDGVVSPYALIDLNNIFSRETSETLDVFQGENLTLLNFGGILGNFIITNEVPEDNYLSEVKPSQIGLKSGWNFFSVQLDPYTADIETVLSPIWDNVVSIWSYDNQTDYWYRYDKNNPFPWLNDLEEAHSQIGYWVFLNNEDSLHVYGTIEKDETIQLHAGWNLIGYNAIETVDLLDSIAPIFDRVQSVWTYDSDLNYWYRYDKNNPFPWLNDLTTITPGKAYWINVDQDCEW